MAHHQHGGASHGSVKEYVTGLVLSIALTLIPFGLVAFTSLQGSAILAVIIVCAVAQLLVQAVFFLHMTGSSSQFWNTTTGIYIVTMILFFVIGTIWIFNHLNHNMLMGH